MNHPVFVYGTLLLGEVQERILGRRLSAREASLAGYARGVVRGQSYPSLRPEASAVTEGALLFGVTGTDLDLLDAYEGERYGRELVDARGPDGTTQAAWVWLLREPWRELVTAEAWSLEGFVRDDLEQFLASYEGLQD